MGEVLAKWNHQEEKGVASRRSRALGETGHGKQPEQEKEEKPHRESVALTREKRKKKRRNGLLVEMAR